MPSKRKLALLAKKKKRSMTGRGTSRYALKKRRVASGWNNPRSPIQEWS